MGSWACSSAGLAMQQLLLVWLLAGVLALPADRVGPLQAAIGLPGVIIMLWGGANADRTDARAILTRVFGAAALVPFGLVLALELGGLNVWTVTAWGLGLSAALSFSSPAQQAVLNRIAGRDLQRGVTAATAISMFTYMIGLRVAGQLDSFGLRQVLLAQSLCLAAAALWIRRIGSQPVNDGEAGAPAWRRIAEGFRASYRQRPVFDAMTVNFVSSIFNAGAFFTVLPFVVLRVYDGDAELLSWLMILFFAGAVVSNLIMLRFMPFQQPGRWFVVLQLSRILVLFLIWIEPAWWLVVTASVAWGLNMGVTTTLARAIVQEAAEPQTRGRVMSVFGLGLLGAPLIGAVILGWIVEEYGALAGLVPGMAASVLLFAYSMAATGLWRYRSS
ncbi:MAG: MFS transporter [Acidobacteriota bacterium]|nr:MFS transporter [Acidobacteriota bacterium]MDE2923984.1 MFS transporter [Acidobacteriota bacterium]MDE3264946.1 MFS transporter [Acidobacteriota bacterium]